MSAFTSWLASPPPDAAVEIASGRVAVATVTARGSGLAVSSYAVEAVPAAAVVPALTTSNIADASAVTAALRAAIDRSGERVRRVALVIPDVAARVTLLHFEQVPKRREDLDQLIRWQLRKSTPFAIEDACVTYSAGAPEPTGTAFIAVTAHRDVIREYEAVCEAAGAHAGLVDLSTLSLLSLFAAPPEAHRGDWLVVHIRPDYTSLAILRGEHVIFFRSRLEGDETSLSDLVHQTAMYHQDRLSGQAFARVLLGGSGKVVELTRRSIEERLGVKAESIDPTPAAALTDRIATTAEVLDVLGPLVGLLVRTRQEAVTP